jgi:glycosyltransferase involved in cell wall biosynthesis
MKVLLVFNYYQQPGGEERIFAAEAALLESKGHCVLRYSVRNDSIDEMSRFALATNVIWNRSAYREVGRVVRENNIDLVHFHNTFPLISPAPYYAARRGRARVVQTLHNFRLVCPGALLSREGRVCEDCLGRSVPWRGVKHACYRGSIVQSAAVTAMLSTHRAAGTWSRCVDRYIALSDFAKQKFVQGGLPEEKIAVKPNFVDPDPGAGEGRGDHALFVGRLSPEKGIATLLRAWRRSENLVPLRIVGDGPLAEEVRSAAARPGSGIEYLGRKSRAETLRLMKEAMVLVFPSVWYEGFPLTIAEAYACGLPVLSSGLGTMASVVKTGITGLHFTPGDPDSLASCVAWMAQHPERVRRFGENARQDYLANYSAEGNYRRLIGIYQEAMETPLPAAAASASEQRAQAHVG